MILAVPHVLPTKGQRNEPRCMAESMQLHASRTLRLTAGVTLLGLIVLVLCWHSNAILPLPTISTTSTKPQTQVLRTGSNDNRSQTRVSCKGARGTLLDEKNDRDLPRPTFQLPGRAYPAPTFGSYDALGLSQGWTTFEQRYGPYGYNNSSGVHDEIDWNAVDWGHLQEECTMTNSARFSTVDIQHRRSRFQHFEDAGDQVAPRYKTGRQAIVLRTWSTYEYHPEDLWNLRSIITEASLATNGDYQVFLLVDLKCGEECKDVFSNTTLHEQILQQSVPKEFQNIAVLLHETLQISWYPKVEETRSMWQIMQPLQLFAHFYPEFDHYWQFEMDARFTGHVGKMLQAFDTFGRDQPYKQARERASWAYMSSMHGTYEEFSAKINASLKGGATIWGPDEIKNVEPIGPTMPSKPEDDDFHFSVGQDADLLLFGQLNDVRRFEKHEDWVFKDWYLGGFDKDIPRYMSVPAQARASYDLLEAIHRSQHEHGLRVPSEATLPSWALWLGLKVVGLPIPRFQYPERDLHELNWVQNGGLPGRFEDGIAHGPGNYRGSSFGFFTRPVTFDWWSSLCDPIFEHWMGTYQNKTLEQNPDHPEYVVVPNEIPSFMAEVDGKVYMPEVILHPRKSNNYHAPG